MVLLLRSLGAQVAGFALPPDSQDGLFETANLAVRIDHTIGDVRDITALDRAMRDAEPSIAIHMAAQSLVRPSYEEPVGTYAVNVMGTVHFLDICRRIDGIQAVVVVTSDKCYENSGLGRSFREADAMGGHDPYSSSKGCAELITTAFRNSFFSMPGAAQVASARAGNVIGGGDWARDRLVPDMMRAFIAGEILEIRYPSAIRPWQHVLDPLIGYLMLAQSLASSASGFAEGWNFGPGAESEVAVSKVVAKSAELWGSKARWQVDENRHPNEAAFLKLDSGKSQQRLGWKPRIDLDQALAMTVEWYKAFARGADVCQIASDQVEAIIEQSSRGFLGNGNREAQVW